MIGLESELESLTLLENISALLVLAGMVMYAAFAGADFGGGVWTALASGKRAKEQRESLFHAIGPVWETNHVWLIFVVVVLFTAFPLGFSALFIALLVPFVLALIGINFRGAAFAFRHFGQYVPTHLPATGAVFSISSILTPFFLGMAVAATAAGRIQIVNGEVVADIWTSWITPFTIGAGLVGLGMCAYITPIYMTVRTQGQLQEDFRIRAIWGALALGGLSTLMIPLSYFDAPQFFERLLRPLPLLIVALAVLSGLTTLLLLWRRRFKWAQYAGDVTIGLTISGFAAALYPYLLIGQMTLYAAASPEPTLAAMMLTLPLGVLILAPSLYLLYRTFGGNPNPDVPL